jgi:asparagine synthase (glutamine-hydrolysing)
MCGFVGIINKSNTVDPLLLQSMANAISHRGPDEEGQYINNNIGFYHKRLSIIDLTTGHQPMESNDLVIVFNGEIYNYVELREELKWKGHVFKTTSDTEVILKMYEEYGHECINKLNGMFSFLIYDKTREHIIAARDHFGIKPLYFFKNKETILFASEIKALLKHPSVKAEVNQQGLSDYLTFQFTLGNSTLFENIGKVTPGHYMIIDLHSLKHNLVKYWTPNFSVDSFHTEEYFVLELRRLIEDTIRIQLRSDVPLGTYLSGGLDSSLVTMIASKILPHQISTFSGAFHEGPEFDESEYIHEVVNFSKAKGYEIYPTVNEFIALLPKLIYHLDEPVAGPGMFPQYMVSKLAAENVKVVLGGQGGDEIFGGYARYVIAYLEQAIKGTILETMEEGEHIVSLNTILPNLPYIKRYMPMLKTFWSNETFEPMDKRYFYLIDRMQGSLDFYTPNFLESYLRKDVFNRYKQLFNDPNTHSYFNKMTHFDMFGSLPALLQVEDRMSMAVSIESRVPLLDRRIVDLVANMPPAMKFKGAEMKYILKRSIGDFLPPKILNRKDKMGFPVPLHLWARNEAKDFISDTLLSKKSKERGIFDMKIVEKSITSQQPFSRQLWGMLSLELWFNNFIDDNGHGMAQFETQKVNTLNTQV